MHGDMEVAAVVLTSYLHAANRRYANMVAVTVVVVVVGVAPTITSALWSRSLERNDGQLPGSSGNPGIQAVTWQ